MERAKTELIMQREAIFNVVGETLGLNFRRQTAFSIEYRVEYVLAITKYESRLCFDRNCSYVRIANRMNTQHRVKRDQTQP